MKTLYLSSETKVKKIEWVNVTELKIQNPSWGLAKNEMGKILANLTEALSGRIVLTRLVLDNLTGAQITAVLAAINANPGLEENKKITLKLINYNNESLKAAGLAISKSKYIEAHNDEDLSQTVKYKRKRSQPEISRPSQEDPQEQIEQKEKCLVRIDLLRLKNQPEAKENQPEATGVSNGLFLKQVEEKKRPFKKRAKGSTTLIQAQLDQEALQHDADIPEQPQTPIRSFEESFLDIAKLYKQLDEQSLTIKQLKEENKYLTTECRVMRSFTANLLGYDSNSHASLPEPDSHVKTTPGLRK